MHACLSVLFWTCTLYTFTLSRGRLLRRITTALTGHIYTQVEKRIINFTILSAVCLHNVFMLTAASDLHIVYFRSFSRPRSTRLSLYNINMHHLRIDYGRVNCYPCFSFLFWSLLHPISYVFPFLHEGNIQMFVPLNSINLYSLFRSFLACFLVVFMPLSCPLCKNRDCMA